MENNREDGHIRAEQLIVDFPDFETASVVSLWIRTAPVDQTLAKIRERFGTTCELPETAYTMARRASDEGLFEEAIRYEEIAVKARPEWTDARSTLALILLEKQFGRIVTAGHSRPAVPNWKDFDRVFSLLSVAIAEVERGQSPAHAAALRQNLAVVFMAVGRQEDALAEYRKAFELDSDNVAIIYCYAQAIGKGGPSDDAIDLLRSWLRDRKAPTITLLLAQFLGSRLTTGTTRRPEDIKEGIAILEAGRNELDGLEPRLRENWIAVLVQLEVDAGDTVAARRILDETPDRWLDTPTRYLLLADIEDAQGRRAEAKTAALKASESIVVGTHPATVRQVAMLLEELGEYRMAAEAWRRMVTMKSVGVDEQHFLECLRKSDDREALIAACRGLRENAVYDHQVIYTELAALERISLERLTQTIQQLLDAPITEKLKKELRAQLSYTSIFNDRPDLIEMEAARLPRSDEVENARAGRMVAEVIRRGRDPVAAVRYAYELFRRLPDEADSHIAMMSAAGFTEGEMTRWIEPSVVGPGAAVNYRENDSLQTMWSIIEDLPSPKPLLAERSPFDPIARAMDGKSVGETFTLRSVPSRGATILEIISKYTYRIRDCLAHFETRFPNHEQAIVQIHAGEDRKAGIDAVLRQIDAITERRKEFDEIYRNQSVTQFIYGAATGRSVFETVHHVVSAPELKLLSNVGTAEEQHAASAAVKRAKSYILDPTAVAMLYILHASGVLKAETMLNAVEGELIISENTLADVRRALASMSPRGGMSIGKQGDQYVRHVVTADDAARQHNHLRDFVALLRTKCSIAVAQHPAHADVEWYMQLVEAIGPAGAESVRLTASRPDAVLWTDELFTAQLAGPQIRYRHVWTKHLIESLSDAHRLTIGTAAASSILHYRVGYHFVGLSSNALSLAAVQSDWKGYKEPLRSLLTQYAEPKITPESAVTSSMGFLIGVWTHKAGRRHQDVARAITSRLIEELLKRPDGRTVAWALHHVVSGRLERHDRALAKQWRKAIRYILNHSRPDKD